MKTLLDMVMKDKQVERYDVFGLLEDIKITLRNQHFSIDSLDARLSHVKWHLQCESDILALLGSTAKYPTPISSSDS